MAFFFRAVDVVCTAGATVFLAGGNGWGGTMQLGSTSPKSSGHRERNVAVSSASVGCSSHGIVLCIVLGLLSEKRSFYLKKYNRMFI